MQDIICYPEQGLNPDTEVSFLKQTSVKETAPLHTTFSMKFFCERYGEGSGKVQLFRCCVDSQFFFQFPKCRFQWFVSCLDVSCRGSIKFSRKRILVL